MFAGGRHRSRPPSRPVPQITLNDGRTIPQLGHGTLALQPDRESTDANAAITAEVVTHALEAGYRHIDTAQAYGTEFGVGGAITASGIPREEIYITSKLANASHAPDDVERSFEQTLERLGADYLISSSSTSDGGGNLFVNDGVPLRPW